MTEKPTGASPAGDPSVPATPGAPIDSTVSDVGAGLGEITGGKDGAEIGGGDVTQSGGPLGFLSTFRTAAPSTFATQVVEAQALSGSALESERTATALDSQPVPSGLEPGQPIETPAPPTLSAPTLNATPPSPGASHGAGTATLEPSGDTDPTLADHWAKAGATALDTTGSAVVVPTPVAGRLRPTRPPAALPKVELPKAAPLPGIAPTKAAGDDAAAILDLNMGPAVHRMVSKFLAPAGAAGGAHTAEVAAVRTATETGLSRVQTDTRQQQEAGAAAADQEVAALHGHWGTQRSSILEEHKSGIAAAAGQTRTEATQTINEANSRAKAKADEEEKNQPEGEKSSGWWGKIKSAGNAVVGAVKGIASSALSFITGIIDAARQKVVGLIQRLADAVKQRLDAALHAISSLAQRVWSAIGQAIKRAQALVARLAAAAVAMAQRLWDMAKARLAAAWDRLKRAAVAAFNAAKAVVQKIASAVGTLREILKILKSGLLEKLFEAAKDPHKLAQPIVDKVAPLAGQVPAKADELTREQGAAGGTPPDAGPPVQRLTVQRDGPAENAAPTKSTGDQAAELVLEGHIRQPDPKIPPAPEGEGFWGGVWRHMKATGNHFLENWQTTLINLVYSLLLFYPVLLQEGPKLWEECKGVIFGGGGVDRFDHVLGVLRHLVNIVAGLVATTGIWALIIGAFTGPGEVIVAGAYETISLGVIGADIALGLAEMAKSWYSATQAGISAETRERYLSGFSGSVIATAITIILVIIGAIASRLARAFKARRAAAGVGDAEGAKGGQKAADGGDHAAGGEKPTAGAGQQHGIGDSNQPRARELVNEEAAKGAKPEEAAGHEVWKTREGCVVCSNPCDFLGGKFREKFAAGTPEAAEFTRRFHQMEALPDGPAKIAAEKTLVTDLENAPAPVPTPSGAKGTLTVEPGVNLSPSERAAAEFWADQGKATTAVKPSTAEAVRTADLNVEGIGRVDVYTPEASTSANRVVGAVLSKGSQTSMVHIELPAGSVVTPAELGRFPGRIFGHPTAGKGINRILVRQNGVVLLDSTRK